MKFSKAFLALLISTCATIGWAAQENTKGLLPEVKLNSANEDVNQKTAFASEVLISKSELKAIESLKKIIAKKKGATDEADLYYRLAELYMRRSKSGRFFDLNLEAQKKLFNLGLPSQEARRYLKDAIVIYDLLEARFPKYSKSDAVLFNNALANSQITKISKAQNLYIKLIQNHPKSILISDAYLEVGELYYNQHKFEMALEKFKAVEKFPNSKAYPYGLYKSAWAFYNLKRTDEGVQQLLTVVRINPADTQDQKKYNLRKEAIRDLTLFVGETMPPDQLYTFFKKITTPDELGEVIINLANLYESHSRYKEISVFAKEFIEDYSTSSHSPKIYARLIDAEETLKNRPQVITYLKNLGLFCQQFSSTECQNDFKKVTLEISKKWWDIWLKNKKHVEFSKLTEQAFEILLSYEDPAKPDYTSRYAYSELLFQTGKYEQAEKNYLVVSEVKTLDKTKQHDALYGALYSIEKQLENPKLQSGDADLLVSRQKELATRYVTEFKNGEHYSSLQFKLGFIAYKQQQYDKSLEILMPFTAEKTAKTEFKNKAEDIILDIYNIKKDFKSIVNTTDKVMKSNGANESRLSQIKTINLEAQFAQMQSDSDGKAVLEQVDILKDFSKKNKDTKLAQESLWKAISLAYANQFNIIGADLTNDYVKAYPKDSKNLDAIKEAARAYVDSGYLPQAISAFRQLAQIESTKTLQHLETSCDLLKVNSQLAEARGCYKGLFSSVSKEKKNQLLVKMMDSFKDNKSLSEFASIENQILQENIEPFATKILINRAKNLLQDKKYSEAFNLSLKINSRPIDTDARAEARLIQALILEKEFVGQSVKARENKFSIVLGLKTEKLDKAYTAYSSTVKMSKNEIIQSQALQGIDRLYTHYIEAVSNMPVPESLTAEEQKQLRGELVKITVPFKEKKQDNINKLRLLSKLSSTTSEKIVWDEFNVEKTVEPRIEFLPVEKISSFLPSSDDILSTSVSRLDRSQKKCNSQDLTATNIGGCIQVKKLGDAEALSLKLAALPKNRSLGLYFLSVIAIEKSQPDKALWMIEKALSTDSFVSFYHFQKGKVLYSVEGLDSALSSFEKSFDIKLKTREINVMYGLKSFSDRDYLSAIQEFSQLGTDELYTYKVATLYVESILQSGQTDQAVNLALKLLGSGSDNVDMHLELARVYEQFSFDTASAAKSYAKALSVSKDIEQRNWLKNKIEFLKTNTQKKISLNVGGE